MTKKRNIFHNRRKTFRMKGGGYYTRLLGRSSILSDRDKQSELEYLRQKGITGPEDPTFLKKSGDTDLTREQVLPLWTMLNTKRADAIQRESDLQLGTQALTYNKQVRDLIDQSKGQAADEARAAAEAAFNQQFGQQLASVGLNQQAAAPPLPASPPPEVADAPPPLPLQLPTVADAPPSETLEELSQKRQSIEARLQEFKERKKQQVAQVEVLAAQAGLAKLNQEELSAAQRDDVMLKRIEQFTSILQQNTPLREENDRLKLEQRKCEENLARTSKQLLEAQREKDALQEIQAGILTAVQESEAKKAELQEQLNVLQTTAGDNALKETQIAALKAFIKQTGEEVERLQGEIKVNKGKLLQKDTEIYNRTVDLRTQREASAAALVAATTSAVREREELQRQLNAALAEVSSKAEENLSKSAEMVRQQEIAASNLQQVNLQKEQLQAQLRTAEANLLTATQENTASLEVARTSAQRNLDAINADQDRLRSQLDVAQATLQANQQEQQRLTTQAEQLTRDKAQVEGEKVEAEAAKLEAEREKVQAQTAKAQAERDKEEVEAKFARSMEQRDRCRREFGELQGRYNLLEESKRNELLEIQQQLDSFQARNLEIDTLNGKLEGLKTQLENVQLGVAGSLTTPVFDTRVESLKAEIQTINRALEPLINLQGQSNRSLSEQFTSLAGTVNTLHTTLQAQTVSILESLSAARSQPELDLVGQAALRAEQAAVEERARELADTQQEIARLQREREVSNEKFRGLKSVSDGLAASLRDCQTALAEEKQRAVANQAATAVLQQNLAQLIEGQRAKEAASERLREELAAKNAAVLAAQQREAEASRQAALAAQTVTGKQAEVTSLTTQLREEQTKGTSSATQISELSSRLAALQAEKQAVTAAAAAAETDKNTAIREAAAASATQQGVAEALAQLKREKDAALVSIGQKDAELLQIRQQTEQAVQEARQAAATEQERIRQEHEAAIEAVRQETGNQAYQEGYQRAQGEAVEETTKLLMAAEQRERATAQEVVAHRQRIGELQPLADRVGEIDALQRQLLEARQLIERQGANLLTMQAEIDRETLKANEFEEALNWHRNPKLIINGKEITKDTELDGTITFRLTQRARKAVAFFEYEGFTDFVDVQTSGEIQYTVKPGLQGVGAFNIKAT